MQAELAQKSADIAMLQAQVKEKEAEASKTAADAAKILALEGEKVRTAGLRFELQRPSLGTTNAIVH